MREQPMIVSRAAPAWCTTASFDTSWCDTTSWASRAICLHFDSAVVGLRSGELVGAGVDEVVGAVVGELVGAKVGDPGGRKAIVGRPCLGQPCP